MKVMKEIKDKYEEEIKKVEREMNGAVNQEKKKV